MMDEQKPGDYNVFEGRAMKLPEECPVCKGYIEVVYEKRSPQPIVYGPGGRSSWMQTKTRCPNCRILFDL